MTMPGTTEAGAGDPARIRLRPVRSADADLYLRLRCDPALMAELVPTSIRTIGVGFGYALATAIFGGTVPALQAWIGGTWGPQYFALYVTAAAVVSIVVLLATVPETLAKDLRAETTTADLSR